MAENKTKQTERSVDEFLSAVENEVRRADAQALLKMMKRVTRQRPKMWGDSIVGFGKYHYKYKSGREGDWFLVGFSPRKASMSVYLMCGFDRLQDSLKKLGKYKTGKGCLYINKLTDVDLDVLEEMVRLAMEFNKTSQRGS